MFFTYNKESIIKYTFEDFRKAYRKYKIAFKSCKGNIIERDKIVKKSNKELVW